MKANVPTNPSEGGRTRQEDAKRSDINFIVNQFRRTGMLPSTVERVANYGFAPSLDYRECMEQVRQAREVFMSLPAATRDHFANDPARFLDYIADKDRKDELVKLGLLIPREKEKPALGSAENPIHTAPVAPES